VRHARAAVHKLETELLKLKRELSAAKRVEASATSAAGSEPDQAAVAPPLDTHVIVANRGVSAAAIKQQSQQLAWRCQARACAGSERRSARPHAIAARMHWPLMLTRDG
jgi:hypothetical protein